MSKIGRNDPCPCGSGKKYKKCCLKNQSPQVSNIGDFNYRRYRRTEGELSEKLMRYARLHYPDNAIYQAWYEFSEDESYDFENSKEFEPLFIPWFFYNWIPEDLESGMNTEIIAEHYLRHSKNITRLEREFIVTTLSSNFDFYQVVSVSPNRGMTLRSLLADDTEEDIFVTDFKGSTQLPVNGIIFTRVLHFDNLNLMYGSSPFLFPAEMREEIEERMERAYEDFVKWEDESRVKIYSKEPDKKVADDILLLIGIVVLNNLMLETYFDLKEVLFAPPKIRNRDGDEIQENTLHYALSCSAQEAYEALMSLSKLDGEPQLESPKYDGLQNLIGFQMPWVVKNRGEWIQKGWIEVDGQKMTVNTNSLERAEEIKRKITRRLGKRARFQLQSIDQKLNMDKLSTAKASEPAEMTEEQRELLAGVMQKHWENWVDESLPALNGLTPKEAAKDPEMRSVLEDLLNQFESKKNPDPLLNPDVDVLRKKLGLFKTFE